MLSSNMLWLFIFFLWPGHELAAQNTDTPTDATRIITPRSNDLKNPIFINASKLNGHLELTTLEIISTTIRTETEADIELQKDDSAIEAFSNEGNSNEPYENRRYHSAGPLSDEDSSRESEEAAKETSTDVSDSGDVPINMEHGVEISETNIASEVYGIEESGGAFGTMDHFRGFSSMEMNDQENVFSEPGDHDESLFELTDPTEENFFTIDDQTETTTELPTDKVTVSDESEADEDDSQISTQGNSNENGDKMVDNSKTISDASEGDEDNTEENSTSYNSASAQGETDGDDSRFFIQGRLKENVDEIADKVDITKEDNSSDNSASTDSDVIEHRNEQDTDTSLNTDEDVGISTESTEIESIIVSKEVDRTSINKNKTVSDENESDEDASNFSIQDRLKENVDETADKVNDTEENNSSDNSASTESDVIEHRKGQDTDTSLNTDEDVGISTESTETESIIVSKEDDQTSINKNKTLSDEDASIFSIQQRLKENVDEIADKVDDTEEYNSSDNSASTESDVIEHINEQDTDEDVGISTESTEIESIIVSKEDDQRSINKNKTVSDENESDEDASKFSIQEHLKENLDEIADKVDDTEENNSSDNSASTESDIIEHRNEQDTDEDVGISTESTETESIIASKEDDQTSTNKNKTVSDENESDEDASKFSIQEHLKENLDEIADKVDDTEENNSSDNSASTESDVIEHRNEQDTDEDVGISTESTETESIIVSKEDDQTSINKNKTVSDENESDEDASRFSIQQRLKESVDEIADKVDITEENNSSDNRASTEFDVIEHRNEQDTDISLNTDDVDISTESTETKSIRMYIEGVGSEDISKFSFEGNHKENIDKVTDSVDGSEENSTSDHGASTEIDIEYENEQDTDNTDENVNISTESDIDDEIAEHVKENRYKIVDKIDNTEEISSSDNSAFSQVDVVEYGNEQETDANLNTNENLDMSTEASSIIADIDDQTAINNINAESDESESDEDRSEFTTQKQLEENRDKIIDSSDNIEESTETDSVIIDVSDQTDIKHVSDESEDKESEDSPEYSIQGRLKENIDEVVDDIDGTDEISSSDNENTYEVMTTGDIIISATKLQETGDGKTNILSEKLEDTENTELYSSNESTESIDTFEETSEDSDTDSSIDITTVENIDENLTDEDNTLESDSHDEELHSDNIEESIPSSSIEEISTEGTVESAEGDIITSTSPNGISPDINEDPIVPLLGDTYLDSKSSEAVTEAIIEDTNEATGYVGEDSVELNEDVIVSSEVSEQASYEDDPTEANRLKIYQKEILKEDAESTTRLNAVDDEDEVIISARKMYVAKDTISHSNEGSGRNPEDDDEKTKSIDISENITLEQSVNSDVTSENNEEDMDDEELDEELEKEVFYNKANTQLNVKEVVEEGYQQSDISTISNLDGTTFGTEPPLKVLNLVSDDLKESEVALNEQYENDAIVNKSDESLSEQNLSSGNEHSAGAKSILKNYNFEDFDSMISEDLTNEDVSKTNPTTESKMPFYIEPDYESVATSSEAVEGNAFANVNDTADVSVDGSFDNKSSNEAKQKNVPTTEKVTPDNNISVAESIESAELIHETTTVKDDEEIIEGEIPTEDIGSVSHDDYSTQTEDQVPDVISPITEEETSEVPETEDDANISKHEDTTTNHKEENVAVDVGGSNPSVDDDGKSDISKFINFFRASGNIDIEETTTYNEVTTDKLDSAFDEGKFDEKVFSSEDTASQENYDNIVTDEIPDYPLIENEIYYGIIKNNASRVKGNSSNVAADVWNHIYNRLNKALFSKPMDEPLKDFQGSDRDNDTSLFVNENTEDVDFFEEDIAVVTDSAEELAETGEDSEEYVPYIQGRIFHHKANFSIQIIAEGVKIHVPSSAYLIENVENPTLNITWASSTNTLNNSLSFSLTQISKYYIINGAQLSIVQDGELLVWKKNVVVEPGKNGNLEKYSCEIEFEDGVKIYVTNIDFLYTSKADNKDKKEDQDRSSESSEMKDLRIYHIEVAVGSLALVVLIGLGLFLAISKARALRKKDKLNHHVAV